MKRLHSFAILAVAALLAASCGGRSGQTESDAPEDAAAEAAVSKKAAADSIPLPKSVGVLPEEPFFDIVTSMGTIRVKLYKDTPKHRDNFARLAITRYYDGLLFHRVIDGFMVQGGDPYTRDTSRVEEWGEGGPGYTVDAEILPEHRHKKGALAAARRGNLANPMRESSGSQFYLVQDSTNCKHLNGEYTVFGETIGGLNVIDRIARVQTDRLDRPVRPVVIQRIRPNEQMNKRALEEEQRALEEAANPTEPEAAKKENTNPEEEILLDVQTELKDSSILGGRKLKHRGSKKTK